ncbi:MBL fold metallo-hydrolase [Streptomyces sp. NPDC006923]|uniref:MBL fold metallo-hydrolase n=1 Tax=Streptomyces sp. NPDC006923 TaxID=3155355 RepID=UPI0033C4E060
MSKTRSPKSLDVNVFNSPRRRAVGERPFEMGPPFGWDPTTATLIYGERDAVLVDALTTAAEGEALASWIALHEKNLTTIYITHGHPDHFFGLSAVLEQFPDAKAIATPGTMELIAQTPPELIEFSRKMWPGLPTTMALPELYESDTFALEGEEIRIIEQGRTDGLHSTSLHVPSIDLVVAGDVLYNQCHMFVGETTPASRENWIAALDRLAALNPKIAVAGHKKTGAPDTPECIEASKRYLRDFGRLKESTTSEQELFEEMDKLYPDWDSHQSWLMFGLPLKTIPEGAE